MPPGTERFVRIGFAVHWLHPRQKAPIGPDWQSRPVATIAVLRRTWREGYNVGVRLGKWSKIRNWYLHVIDMDVRDQAFANEARSRLTRLFPNIDLSAVPTVVSGSGGASRHFYILTDRPFPSKKLAHGDIRITGQDGKQRWNWEIELFGTGKQVVMPPSIHPETGQPYRWERPFRFEYLDLGVGPIVPSSDIERLTDEERSETAGDRSEPLGLGIAEIERVLEGLPLDDWCHDRDGWLKVGMALHHELDGSKKGFQLWTEFSRQSSKFDFKDQTRVWRSFKGKPIPVRMATLVQAAREARLSEMFETLDDTDSLSEDETPEKPGSPSEKTDSLDDRDLFGDDPPPRVAKLRKAEVEDELGHVPPKVKRLNERHALARVSSRTVIMDFHPDGTVSYGSVGDLHAFYENDRVATDKGTEPVTKLWMRHRKRRTYPGGIVFAPQGGPPNAYNLWQGFAVDPDPKASCQRLLSHCFRVLCDRDQAAYDYLIGWMAHLVQRPWEKPGVAVVIRGKKGVGKDTLGDYLGRLFPHHHVKIANQEQLVGKFNAHQEKCLLLHVEEGYWAGNKQAEGALKFLITSERVPIEPKGLNIFYVDSVLRLFMTSNEDWVVPASPDERRYFVLDANAERRGDLDYFRAIREEMNAGGPAALLHYLQTYDLTGFEVRDVPDTTALAMQKAHGLRNFERWWFGMLQNGRLDLDVEDQRERAWAEGSVRVSRDDLRDAYQRWMRSRRYDGEVLRDFEIGRRLHDLCSDVSERRPWKTRKREYVIPDLETCRRAFERFLGSEILWSDDD